MTPSYPPYFLTFHNFMDIDTLYYHWKIQGLTMEADLMLNNLSPAGPSENATVPVPNNVASSFQVHPKPILTHPRPVNTSTQKIEEASEIMRETRTKIIVLKDIKVMVFNDKYTKKFILICPQNLINTSLDIWHPFNP